MKELLPYITIGVITAIILNFMDLDLRDLLWWVLMIPMNLVGIHIYDNYIKRY